MRNRRAGLSALSAVLLTGCAATDQGDMAGRAENMCVEHGLAQARGYSATGAELLAAYAGSSQAFDSWDRDRHGPAGPHPEPIQRTTSPGPLALCYFSGEFNAFPRARDGSSPDGYRRLALTVDSAGFALVHRVGPENMDLTAPGDFSSD